MMKKNDLFVLSLTLRNKDIREICKNCFKLFLENINI